MTKIIEHKNTKSMKIFSTRNLRNANKIMEFFLRDYHNRQSYKDGNRQEHRELRALLLEM